MSVSSTFSSVFSLKSPGSTGVLSVEEFLAPMVPLVISSVALVVLVGGCVVAVMLARPDLLSLNKKTPSSNYRAGRYLIAYLVTVIVTDEVSDNGQ